MPKDSAAFLDTTILVDRVLRDTDDAFLERLRAICDRFKIKLTSSFAKLEFKNVVLMDLQCVANWIEEEDSFVAAFVRASRMQSRRKDTLVNVAAWVQRKLDRSIEVQRGDSVDAALREQALVYIYNAIEYLWYRFDREVDSISDNMKCKRVLEAPRRMDSGKVTVRNHRSQCKSLTCNNVGVFEANLHKLREIVEELRQMQERNDERMTDELRNVVSTFDYVKSNRNRLCDFSRCLGLGDLWIHLEAGPAGATSMVTRNYKESRVLCDLLGIQMVNPDQCS